MSSKILVKVRMESNFIIDNTHLLNVLVSHLLYMHGCYMHVCAGGGQGLYQMYSFTTLYCVF